MERLVFGIDFDETLTSDPALFRSIIELIRKAGHKVVCVTARRDTDENIAEVEGFLIDNQIDIHVFYTSLRSKVDFMKSRGINVNIWIDDNPKVCALGM